MSSRECEIQLNELIEAWELNEALLNQTDIEAIKHLLLENQIQQDVMVKYKLKTEKLEDANNEAREYVNNHIHQETFTGYMDSYELKKLLQILDKTKEN